MLSFNQIKKKFADQIDLAGSVSAQLRDQHKYLLDKTSECHQTALNLWSDNIISFKEYSILDEVIEGSFHKALDRYYE